MAAAVAKAQEKNRVPESPQVLWLFLIQDTQRETTPLSLPIGTGLQPSWVWAELDTDKTSWGSGEGEDDKQKTKPKYRTISKFSKPFQTTCLGWGKRTTELRHQTLKALRTKYQSKQSCFFWSQEDGAVRLSGQWPHKSSMEQCSSHVWLLSHVYIGCFKASMHVLYPESLLFSVTKDIRIKLILYYQTLYTTEVANNTELKNAFFF